jgi:hypothetical protein
MKDVDKKMSKLQGSTELLSRNIEASLTEKLVGIEKIAFSSIAEYDDLKRIVIRTLEIKENYNPLFVGPPASAKTLFWSYSMILKYKTQRCLRQQIV